jgi:hypothetical protein
MKYASIALATTVAASIEKKQQSDYVYKWSVQGIFTKLQFVMQDKDKSRRLNIDNIEFFASINKWEFPDLDCYAIRKQSEEPSAIRNLQKEWEIL